VLCFQLLEAVTFQVMRMRIPLCLALCVAGGALAHQLSITPSCATGGGVCPLPAAPWQTTWKLSKSTICQVCGVVGCCVVLAVFCRRPSRVWDDAWQPGNTKGFLNATEAARWGYVAPFPLSCSVWRALLLFQDLTLQTQDEWPLLPWVQAGVPRLEHRQRRVECPRHPAQQDHGRLGGLLPSLVLNMDG
jgi:hypothetical protein